MRRVNSEVHFRVGDVNVLWLGLDASRYIL